MSGRERRVRSSPLSDPQQTTTDPTRVLVVEDAPEYATIIEVALRREGHDARTVPSGEAALELLEAFRPAVIVLDVVLPGIDGVEVCRRIRRTSDAYVIMLTARAEEVDKLIGLAVGADDYITKPFSPRELVARVAAMMRRPRSGADVDQAVRRFGRLSINPRLREVCWDSDEIPLTKIEFDLLDQISSRSEMVHARQLLLDSVWGTDFVGDDHVVDVHIANLRRKIDREGVRHLKTIRGVGYRMAVALDTNPG